MPDLTPTHSSRTRPLRRVLLGLAAGALILAGSVQAEPREGGVLNLVAQPEPPSLMHGVVSHVSTQYVSGKILQGLLTYDTTLQPKPVRAKSWTLAPDGLTYTFDLQDGVRWNGGQPFTSADVVFSFQTFYPEVDKRLGGIFTDYVASIEATGPLQVIFHLKKPFAPLLSSLGSGLRPVVPQPCTRARIFATTPTTSSPWAPGRLSSKNGSAAPISSWARTRTTGKRACRISTVLSST